MLKSTLDSIVAFPSLSKSNYRKLSQNFYRLLWISPETFLTSAWSTCSLKYLTLLWTNAGFLCFGLSWPEVMVSATLIIIGSRLAQIQYRANTTPLVLACSKHVQSELEFAWRTVCKCSFPWIKREVCTASSRMSCSVTRSFICAEK